ncbi:MAG: DUF998 domain-containing protein [Actinomycetales bacterium]|nr:DUF998 domain-containing protein [Actinomycetales bacterium]
MPFAPRLAKVLAWIAAVTACLGTELVGATWPGYSSWRQVVSTLAAVGAPTRPLMNAVLVVTLLALAALGLVLRAASALGRGFLMISAAAVAFAVAFPFPAPDVDTGPHTAAVTFAMVMLGFAPLACCASWRRGQWGQRWRQVLPATLVLVAMGLTFLANWLKKSSIMGVTERVFVAAEMAVLIWAVSAGVRPREVSGLPGGAGESVEVPTQGLPAGAVAVSATQVQSQSRA